MTTSKLLLLMIVGAGLCAQVARNQPEPAAASQQSKQPYQRPQNGKPYQPREDFFHYSTKLVNRNDVDYGAWAEERRRALVEASLTNPFFWYSALTTSLVMVLMLPFYFVAGFAHIDAIGRRERDLLALRSGFPAGVPAAT